MKLLNINFMDNTLLGLKDGLLKIVDNIDAGNSKLTEEQTMSLLKSINEMSNTERPLSKYEAYTYLNISRATFDNHVARGWIPKGKPMPGFKELAWSKKDLDTYLELYKGRK